MPGTNLAGKEARRGDHALSQRGLHRKAALTTIHQPFNFRTVDDRKDWLK